MRIQEIKALTDIIRDVHKKCRGSRILIFRFCLRGKISSSGGPGAQSHREGQGHSPIGRAKGTVPSGKPRLTRSSHWHAKPREKFPYNAGRSGQDRMNPGNGACQQYAVGQARGALYPSLTLGGAIGWTNSFGGVVNPAGLLLSATASVLEPIFNARVNVTKLKISKSQQQEALLNFQQTILNAGAEVNNALSQYQSARERSILREKQTASLEKAVRKTELLMQHSSTTYLDVLTAQQSLLSAQTELVQDRYDMAAAVISLYHALGGGVESH